MDIWFAANNSFVPTRVRGARRLKHCARAAQFDRYGFRTMKYVVVLTMSFLATASFVIAATGTDWQTRLREYQESKDAQARTSALNAMCDLDEPDINSIFRAALKDAEPLVRQTALSCLKGRLKELAAIHFRFMFDDQSPLVRTSAAIWLSHSFTDNGADPSGYMDVFFENQNRLLSAVDDEATAPFAIALLGGRYMSTRKQLGACYYSDAERRKLVLKLKAMLDLPLEPELSHSATNAVKNIEQICP